jgi:VWFA-related protein
MNSTVKLRSAILAFCVLLMMGGSRAQDSANLPAAPSAAKQPAPAPESAQPAQPAAGTPAPEGKTQTASTKPADQPPAPAASGAATDDESVTTIRKIVNEVNVVFTVTDKHGHYVKDLKKDDFKILDDQKPAEEIRSFRAETDLPLEAGLLIDASNSIRDRFKFEQEAAIEFLNQTVRHNYDLAFVIGFDVTPEVTQDFTDNTEKLSQGVRVLRPGGGTALYDALYFACRDKLMKAQHNGAVRKAIILLTDGEDNQSHVTREEAIDMAQRAEVVVYTISTNLTGSGNHGDKVLERIAEATGGRSYVPFQLSDVANAFAAIQEELRSQYAVSYKPADFVPDGRYRSIEILAAAKGMHVRSRHGYYAPSQ